MRFLSIPDSDRRRAGFTEDFELVIGRTTPVELAVLVLNKVDSFLEPISVAPARQ
jgi:hypothetical protein